MSTALTQQSPYSSLNSYNTPYSRFNSPYGGGAVGGYGGLGNTYGGFGSYGGYGMNSMYPGFGGGYMPGQMGNPYDPMSNPSLTQSLEGATQNTFALLHSIVQTFSGVAQMLESTFMATHSSFFAMIGVVDQFAQLRNALGSVLGLFGLVRSMRDLLTGRTGSDGGMRGEFREFINGKPVQGPRSSPPPKASKKPLIVFLLAAVGIPWAMHRLVRIITERQRLQLAAGGVPGQPLPPLDPSQLQFARALYSFAAGNPTELELKENEIVAIMGKLDPRTGVEVDPRSPMEEEGEWWKGRTKDGREGWFPRKWVEILERRKEPEAKKVD
jgi:peroxin-13